MQNSQRAILGTLDGAEEFLDQNAEALGGVAANGTRKKLGTIVSALTSHHTTQTQSVVSAQQLTLSTSAARRALLQDHLASIAAVAKAELPSVPELAVARRAPKATAPVGTLLTRAESVAKAVAPFTDTSLRAASATVTTPRSRFFLIWSRRSPFVSFARSAELASPC